MAELVGPAHMIQTDIRSNERNARTTPMRKSQMPKIRVNIESTGILHKIVRATLEVSGSLQCHQFLVFLNTPLGTLAF
jgi:hypothetical protein